MFSCEAYECQEGRGGAGVESSFLVGFDGKHGKAWHNSGRSETLGKNGRGIAERKQVSRLCGVTRLRFHYEIRNHHSYAHTLSQYDTRTSLSPQTSDHPGEGPHFGSKRGCVATNCQRRWKQVRRLRCASGGVILDGRPNNETHDRNPARLARINELPPWSVVGFFASWAVAETGYF